MGAGLWLRAFKIFKMSSMKKFIIHFSLVLILVLAYTGTNAQPLPPENPGNGNAVPAGAITPLLLAGALALGFGSMQKKKKQ